MLSNEQKSKSTQSAGQVYPTQVKNQAAKRERRAGGKGHTVPLESLGVGGGEEKGEAAGEQDEESG